MRSWEIERDRVSWYEALTELVMVAKYVTVRDSVEVRVLVKRLVTVGVAELW